MKRLLNVLLVVERSFIIIATVLAAFPLYQFYIEADARRLERSSNFVSAFQACEELVENRETRLRSPTGNSWPDMLSILDHNDFLDTLTATEKECRYIFSRDIREVQDQALHNGDN